MKADPFIIERVFNAPIEKVWKAISEKNEMQKWFLELHEFKAEPGFRFSFKGGKDPENPYLHLCEVKEVITGKKLSYTWRYDGYPGDSLVSFELFDEGEKTRLKLTHAGLESFSAANNPDLDAKNFATGWGEIIGNNLKAHLEL